MSGAGQGILTLSIKDKSSLYTSYIPFITNGGLFIRTTRSYKLGDELFMLLTLLDDPEKLPVAGKVIWITPKGASGSRSPGIGVQFSEQDNGEISTKIEALLGGSLATDRPTQTM